MVDVLHLGYGGAGGGCSASYPCGGAAAGTAGPLFGLTLWLGHVTGIAPVLDLRIERRRDLREWAVLAADHVLYGLVVARLAGRSD